MSSIRSPIIGVAALLLLVAAACGNDGSSDESSTTTSEGATTTQDSGGVDATAIPLGDGKISEAPRRGSLWSCMTDAMGGGAAVDGPWIHGDTWNMEEKVEVPGDVEWPQAMFTISVEDEERVLTGNGLPRDATTGVFPIPGDSEAYEYDRNPNSIGEYDLEYRLPASPTLADEPSCAPGMVGVATSGVVLFNAFDALLRDAVAHEVQDHCDGHPQESSVYHYHGLSACFDDPGTGHSALFAYALDGFGIYGTRGENGEELSNADLDECHGHVHEITWDDETVELYHYHATIEFPYTVGCFRGTAVEGQPPGGGAAAGGAPQSGPPG